MEQNNELDIIQQQILELEKKKKELLEKIEKERIEKELNSKLIFSVIEYVNNYELIVDSNKRWDNIPEVNDILFITPKRREYRYDFGYAYRLHDFANAVRQLLQLANVEIHYGNEKLQQLVEDYINSPNISIDLNKDKSGLIVKIKSGLPFKYYDWRHKTDLPLGIEIPNRRGSYSVQLGNAWKLIELMSTLEDVVWSDEALFLADDQIKKRELLNNIAIQEDAPEIDAEFIGDYKLRNFQKVGVKFIEHAGGNALLCDDVGLGKTAQAIAVIRRNKWNGLIVCPAKLVPNWERNIRKFTGQDAHVLSNTIPQKSDIIKIMTEKKQYTIISLSTINRGKEYIDKESEETLVSWEWVRWLSLAKFDIVVLDEGHKIKDTSSKMSQAVRQLEAPRFLVMTATPIMNRPAEFWPTLSLVRPDLFPSKEAFISQYTLDGKTTRNMEEFHDLMRGIMIRRKRSQVQKDLPPVQRIAEYHTLSSGAKERYNLALLDVYQAIDKAGNKWQEDIPNILVKLMRLKQICAEDKIERVSDLAVELYDGSEGDPHRKVLIFSQFTEDPAIVPRIAQRLGNEALWFTGKSAPNMDTRMNIIDQFTKRDDIHFLVASSKAADEGLDITAAGHIIFNDLMWTPMAHHQCEGRAYGRESDPHSINSYYVTAKDTIEEWIEDLLESKLNMFSNMVEGVEDNRLNLSIATEIITKLKMKRK